MNSEISAENAIAKHNSKHVAGMGLQTTLDADGTSALDLFNTPHNYVKVSKPMIGYGAKSGAGPSRRR